MKSRTYKLSAIGFAVATSVGCTQMVASVVAPNAEADYRRITGDTGADADKLCVPKISQNPAEMYASQRDCAVKNNRKTLVTENTMRYSEYQGNVEKICNLVGFDRKLVPDRLMKGTGLLQPILIIRENGMLEPDWPATTTLHQEMTSRLKLKLLPLSETRRYHDIAIKYMTPKVAVSAVQVISGAFSRKRMDGKEYYEEVLSKFPNLQYVLELSNGAYEGFNPLNTDVAALKLFADQRKAPKSLRANELQDLLRTYDYYIGALKSAANSNLGGVQLAVDLVERQAARTDVAGMTTIKFQLPVCSILDYAQLEAFTKTQPVAQVADNKASGDSGFFSKLGKMVNVDTSKGLEVSIDSSNLNAGLIDEREKELQAAWLQYSRSAMARQSSYRSDLLPFVTKAFSEFKFTGFVGSSTLR
jgi:hypothetical protein